MAILWYKSRSLFALILNSEVCDLGLNSQKSQGAKWFLL